MRPSCLLATTGTERKRDVQETGVVWLRKNIPPRGNRVGKISMGQSLGALVQCFRTLEMFENVDIAPPHTPKHPQTCFIL